MARQVFRPRPSSIVPVITLALYGIGTFLVLTAHQLAFGHADGAETYLRHVLDGEMKDEVVVPYGSDLVGSLLLLVFLVSPSLFAFQIRSIDLMVKSMIDNGLFEHPGPLGVEGGMYRARLAAAVTDANRWFERVGSWWGSLGVGLLATGTVGAIFWSFSRYGIYGGQLGRVLGNDYSGDEPVALHDMWWMGPGEPVVRGLVIGAGVLFFYLLYKELLMGVVFSDFAYRLLRGGIVYTPKLTHDSDGFWGMRGLRNFIRTTYVVTLIEVTTYFTIFWFVQEPRPVTLVLGLVVITGPLAFVVLPTIVARHCVIQAKRRYVQGVMQACGDPTLADAVWESPNLPFGVRKIASATLISLIFPALLIVLTGVTKA